MLTTHYLPGTPCWLDVGAPDLEAANAFYTTLFGWRSISLGPDHGDYRICLVGDKSVAGIGRMTSFRTRPAWLTYFHTRDADVVAKTVEQAGGQVLAAPAEVEGQGRMAVFADPAGASFAVWQPGANRGLGLVTDTGSLGWVELYVPDPVAIRSFYTPVFGWRVEELAMGDMPYPVISPAEGDESSAMAGIVQLEGGEGAHWLPYIEVRDCDATVTLAQELGGATQTAPMTMEGVGRMAFLTDPFSARFAVITSTV